MADTEHRPDYRRALAHRLVKSHRFKDNLVHTFTSFNDNLFSYIVRTTTGKFYRVWGARWMEYEIMGCEPALLQHLDAGWYGHSEYMMKSAISTHPAYHTHKPVIWGFALQSKGDKQ